MIIISKMLLHLNTIQTYWIRYINLIKKVLETQMEQEVLSIHLSSEIPITPGFLNVKEFNKVFSYVEENKTDLLINHFKL